MILAKASACATVARKSVELETRCGSGGNWCVRGQDRARSGREPVAAFHVAERGFSAGLRSPSARLWRRGKCHRWRRLAGAQPFAEQFGLGSLAHARRSEEHQTKNTRWQRRENFALDRTALNPGYSNLLRTHIISMDNLIPTHRVVKTMLIQEIFKFQANNYTVFAKNG